MFLRFYDCKTLSEEGLGAAIARLPEKKEERDQEQVNRIVCEHFEQVTNKKVRLLSLQNAGQRFVQYALLLFLLSGKGEQFAWSLPTDLGSTNSLWGDRTKNSQFLFPFISDRVGSSQFNIKLLSSKFY